MELTVEQLAKICHDTKRAYSQCIGDNTHMLWENIPESEQKAMMRSIEYHLANPHANAEDSHAMWFIQRQITGWKYGRYKDIATKEHPYLVTFDLLPREQQIKQQVIKAMVDTLREFVIQEKTISTQ